MADENNVENPGAGDEIPAIPVPDNEVQGTPVPADETPDESVQGTPVPEDVVFGTPAPDEGSYGTPAEPRAPKVKGPMGWRGSSRWPLWMVIGCLSTCCLCCVLPLCILAVAGGGLAAVFKNSETSDTQTEQLTIDPNELLTLSVDGTNGSIDIRRGDSDDEVSITYTRTAHGWTKSAAEKELERITVDIQQPADNKNEITITVDSAHDENWLWSQTSEVDMTITIPEEAAISVNSATGSITVADVSVHALDLHTNTGSITFDGSLAPGITSQMELQTNTGSISVVLPADTTVSLSAETNTGSVDVSDSFDRMTDVSESQDGAGGAWTGTLGDSTADSPMLRLFTNTGSIDVVAR